MDKTVGSVPATVDELNALSREELFELFVELDSPSIEEFRGEFQGHGAVYLPNLEAYYRAAGLGPWLGKGYMPERSGAWAGHGYNLWGRDQGVIRRTQFGFGLGTSMLDGRPCVLMHYSAFKNLFAEIDLIDEIRRVGGGLYLGLATTKEPSPLCPEPGGPEGRSLPSTFLLAGPTGAWVGPDTETAETPSTG